MDSLCLPRKIGARLTKEKNRRIAHQYSMFERSSDVIAGTSLPIARMEPKKLSELPSLRTKRNAPVAETNNIETIE
jgi:hypothetical protein